MKKVLFMTILFFMFMINVYAASDYYTNINVNFNHNGCEETEDEVTIQLFCDGKKVEGSEVTLNPTTGYSYTYENLQIFKPDTYLKYDYEVKILEDGKYRLISEKSYTYDTAHISKWVQVLPEDIKEGHTYVITTDNWNYESNGFSKTIYLRGDITAKGAPVVAEYNIIDGKPSYYVLDAEPIENTKWTVSKVPTDDADYETFKDYLMFTNEGGKKLTLTGYINGSNVNWIYKYSGKNGFIESENAMYTNKVTLTPVENSKGRFYIGTYNLLDEPNNKMQYITLSGQNQYQAGSNMAQGAQFKAFEYVDTDVELGVNINVGETLCKKDTVVLNHKSEFNRKIDVNLDCTECEEKKDKGITIQLFADGNKVEDAEILLNRDNNFSYTYDKLPVFDDNTQTVIDYEVKILDAGKYYSIPTEDVTNNTETISKWTQVAPSDIASGHTYILVTENKNYESNGFSRYIYLRGDVTAKGASVNAELNTVNNKTFFYTFSGEPIENTKWVTSSVPTDDPDYETFKNYIMFTNEGDKKLTLTGYENGSNINWIYKYSGKNGYIDSESAMYTNKVSIIPTNNNFNTFYIGTKNLFDEPNNIMQYLSLSNQNQYQANPNIENAAEFMAFEFTENSIITSSAIVIKPSLCEIIEIIENSTVNPKTGVKNIVIYLSLLVMLNIMILVYIKAKVVKLN